MNIRTLCIAAFVSVLGFSAHAAETAGDPTQNVGQSTRSWLSIQRGNSQAAPERPMLGAVSVLAYQRYVESYKTRIPESFLKSDSKSGTTAH